MPSIDNFIKDLKILYVEDDNLQRKKVSIFLKNICNNVKTNTNILDGYITYVNAFNEHNKFDIVISSKDIKNTDGLGLLSEIRRIDSLTPFIFVANTVDPEQLIEALNLNINGYILKSDNLNELHNQIQKVSHNIYRKRIYLYQKKTINNHLNTYDMTASSEKVGKKGLVFFR